MSIHLLISVSGDIWRVLRFGFAVCGILPHIDSRLALAIDNER
jgi:hypothetical protein